LHEAVRVNAQNLAHENARLLDKQQISEEYQAELELEEND
jgi:hypothetical protein